MKRSSLDIKKYVYFYNKIYNRKYELQGVESVLREQDANHEWVLPPHVDTLPFFILQDNIKQSLENVRDNHFKVIVKLTLEQFLSRDFKKKIAQIVENIKPLDLVIEISYHEIVKRKRVRSILRKMIAFKKQGVLFSINNLGADFSFAKRIHYLLPVIDILKLDIKYFNHKEKWLDLPIAFWGKLANKYQLALIVSGVETKADEHLLDVLAIDLRSGYLYGMPEQFI
ncbi:MAG: EAL domain-containing protein [Leuconostoc citreum]